MKIEKSTYTGYLWYSDEKEPSVVLINEDYELEIPDSSNPFIIEGQLCDANKSISIKYVDGKYRVKEYKLSELSGDFENKAYYANRIIHKTGQIEKLKFKQYWKPESDSNCNGFDVLNPEEFVFVGFEMED